ncbi:MAG: hypothetical protein ACXVCE_16575, partial [Bacteriovorax sp.]
MKKIILTTTAVLSLTINLFADETANLPLVKDSVFANLRESKSQYISAHKEKEINDLYRGTRDMETLRRIIVDPSVNRCATKVVNRIKNDLGLASDKDVERAILGLRLDDSIDDVSANILMKANNISLAIATPIAKDDMNEEEENKALEIYKTKVTALQNKNLCLEDSYRELVGALSSEAPKYYRSLKHINKIALDNDLISESLFKRLEVLRASKVHEWPLTLSGYAENLENINKRFVERKKESASLVTSVKFRQKKSLRQSLYERFDSTQIILLANIVKGLKTRLESKDVTINIDYVDRPTEIINLSPMEKFRFILKLLRKELSDINNSTLLGGKTASYMDLIAASYEVGYINANEIEQ